MSGTDRQPRVVNGLGDLSASRSPTGSIDGLQLDTRAYDRALDCVHCGLCLPACPTYTANGLEADSPRGRIILMRGMADGRIEPTDAVLNHLDLCLDCRACETVCPSGVVYHELIEETRHVLHHAGKYEPAGRLVSFFLYRVLPYATRLKLAVLPVRVLQRLGLWKIAERLLRDRLPAPLEKMRQMLPAEGPLWPATLKNHYVAQAGRHIRGRRPRVALFTGCVGSVLFQQVNEHAVEVLRQLGCEVFVPPKQVCCGAIHHHGGRGETARAMAVTNLHAFERQEEPPFDAVVTAVAGCGAMLREYGDLLRHKPQAEQAEVFASRVRDVTELIAEMGPASLPHPIRERVTYHDPCHLAHAQGVVDPPRRVLSWIDGLEVVPLPESDMCCGAAGTYNLSQPAMSHELAERKIRHIASTGCRVLVTGNVGCAMQIESEALRLGLELEVVHPVTLLHRAIFGPSDKEK